MTTFFLEPGNVFFWFSTLLVYRWLINQDCIWCHLPLKIIPSMISFVCNEPFSIRIWNCHPVPLLLVIIKLHFVINHVPNFRYLYGLSIQREMNPHWLKPGVTERGATIAFCKIIQAGIAAGSISSADILRSTNDLNRKSTLASRNRPTSSASAITFVDLPAPQCPVCPALVAGENNPRNPSAKYYAPPCVRHHNEDFEVGRISLNARQKLYASCCMARYCVCVSLCRAR